MFVIFSYIQSRKATNTVDHIVKSSYKHKINGIFFLRALRSQHN